MNVENAHKKVIGNFKIRWLKGLGTEVYRLEGLLEPGLPDMMILCENQVVFIELKSKADRLRPSQLNRLEKFIKFRLKYFVLTYNWGFKEYEYELYRPSHWKNVVLKKDWGPVLWDSNIDSKDALEQLICK